MWSDRWRDCTSSPPWESPSPSTDKSAPRESCRILPKKCLCRSGGGKSEGWNPYIWPLKPLASCMFVFHWVMKSWLLLPQITCSSWPEIMAPTVLEFGWLNQQSAASWLETEILWIHGHYFLCPSRNTGCRMMFRCPSQTYPWRILTVLLYMVCHGSHQYTPFMLPSGKLT